MAEKKRSATKDYKALSSTPWDLWDPIYKRKSHRKYTPGGLPRGFDQRVDEVIGLSVRVRNAQPRSVMAFTDGATVQRIQVGCRKGAMNKINFWVGRPGPSGFLLMEVPEDDLSSGRPAFVGKASLVMEDAVLWLTEQELGTCWLGGVNQRELSVIAGSPTGSTVPIAVPFGWPAPDAATGVDKSGLPLLARPRKNMSAVAFTETLAAPYRTGEFEQHAFELPAAQDIRGALEHIDEGQGRGSKTDVPYEVVIEACLEAGRVAPSAGNSQPWSFISVRDEERLKALQEACGTDGWEMAVVVLAKESSWRSALAERPFWMMDGPIALSHISLMAASMGRAVSVLVGGFEEKAMTEAVGAEEGVRAVGVAFIGG